MERLGDGERRTHTKAALEEWRATQTHRAPDAHSHHHQPHPHRPRANAYHIITMYRAGILIAIFAIAALTLSPEPSLAQSLTQQAERPASGRASANTAAASRGRPDDLASRGRPLKWGAPSGIKSEKPHGYEPHKPDKPHGYEPHKPDRPHKPDKPHKPDRPHKPDKPHKPEPPWCEPEAYCESDKDCHAIYPCKHTECDTSRKYRDKTWPKKGKCVCEGELDLVSLSTRPHLQPPILRSSQATKTAHALLPPPFLLLETTAIASTRTSVSATPENAIQVSQHRVQS